MSRVAVLAVSVLIGGLLLGGVGHSQSLMIGAVGVSDVAPVSLDGFQKVTTAVMDNFTVTDSRDTGEGWSVSVQGTQFAQWNGTAYVPGGATLPAGSLSMPAPGVAAVGTESPPPTITPGPYLIDGASVKIASAAPGEGMGRYDFNQGGSLVLTVPSRAFAVTYRSEVTVSVSSGP